MRSGVIPLAMAALVLGACKAEEPVEQKVATPAPRERASAPSPAKSNPRAAAARTKSAPLGQDAETSNQAAAGDDAE